VVAGWGVNSGSGVERLRAISISLLVFVRTR